MKTRIVRIGNSKGVRIPKPMLEQTGLQGEVDITVEQDALVIRSARKPREGWEESFQEMARAGDDTLLDDPALGLSSWDEEEWEWQWRFDVVQINLDPTVGTEIRKMRPCLVVSPDEMNRTLRTIIVAPMTTRVRPYASRVLCRFKGKEGQVALDQIRTVDQARVVKKMGRIDSATAAAVLQVLHEMFMP